jgi:hypothetical protein
MGQEVSMITLTRREALQMAGQDAIAGGGATLFHEHLSLGPDFGDRFRAAVAAVLAAQGESPPANPSSPPPAPPGPDPMGDVDLMAEELRSAQRDGVAEPW